MNTMKKLFASLLAVMLMASMLVLPASAVTNYTITIESSESAHQYEAYQIFTGDLSGSVLSNIVWGSGISTAGQAALGDAGEKAETLKNSSDAQTFIEGIVNSGYLAANCGTSTYDSVNKVHTISVSGPGYYLVKDVANSIDPDQYHAYTDYILRVVADVSVTPKAAVPVLTKRVSRDKSTGYAEAVSASIGKEVYFELKGSMHAHIADYDTYSMTFTDVLPAGLDYNTGYALALYVMNNNNAANYTAIPSGQFTSSYDEGSRTLTVSVPDAKAAIKAATGTDALTQDSIVVSYSAVVNKNVVIGSAGNKNQAYLVYSNNPHGTTTGKTNTVTATVYSYQLDLKKVDGANTTKLLPGAEFVVYRYKSTTEKEYLTVANNKVTGGVADKAGATTLRSDSNGMIHIIGVPSGTYYFEETKAPEGYNKLDDEVGVMISASLNASTGHLDTFSGTIIGVGSATSDINSGLVTITVANNAGATLPSTGGMGTTLFYIVGVALMVGAIAVFVAKKRTDATK